MKWIYILVKPQKFSEVDILKNSPLEDTGFPVQTPP